MTAPDPDQTPDPDLEATMKDLLAEVEKEPIPARLRDLALRLEQALQQAGKQDHS